MKISGPILDDVLRKAFRKLLHPGLKPTEPSRGAARELVGALIELTNPRARLSRTETRGKPFSALGEFLWYMSRGNRLDFIRYYIPLYAEETEDDETVHGGYGPRLFNQRGHDQLKNVVDLLARHPQSRRAVVQLFNAEDIARRHKEIPCTCTFQFMARGKRLHMVTTMRSNDAFKGLPHDVFCFTLIQEVVARQLGLELGTYRHFVGSLHLYETDRQAAQQYLDEGVQATVTMQPMPTGDPWPSIRKLLDAEQQIRQGAEINTGLWGVDAYWADLIRLLQIFAATGDAPRIEAIKAGMTFDRYAPYIDPRKTMKPRVLQPPPQLVLPL